MGEVEVEAEAEGGEEEGAGELEAGTHQNLKVRERGDCSQW